MARLQYTIACEKNLNSTKIYSHTCYIAVFFSVPWINKYLDVLQLSLHEIEDVLFSTVIKKLMYFKSPVVYLQLCKREMTYFLFRLMIS